MKYDIVKLMARRKIRWKKRWVSGDSGGRLTFRSKKAGRLSDYRIYGNTVNGESVGDRTGNLFDGAVEQGSFNAETGGETVLNTRVRSKSITLGDGNYTISAVGVDAAIVMVYLIDGIYTKLESIVSYNNLPFSFSLDAERIIRFAFKKNDDSGILPSDISNMMLNSGSTALPFEPYGYKVPVTVSNGTDTQAIPIYLPEQIRKVGDEAEYIDYGEQKLHRVRKNLWSGIVEQGSVSTLGDYANDSSRIRSKNISLSPGTYTISCNLGIRCIYAYNNSEKVSLVVDNGGRAAYRNTFTIPSGANNVSISLRAFNASGTEINNITPSDFIWGQIEKGSEVTTYEPFIENTEVDVTLPALPTLTGTNVLSVGTAVQPSRVEVKGRIKAVGQEPEPEPEAAEAEQE